MALGGSVLGVLGKQIHNSRVCAGDSEDSKLVITSLQLAFAVMSVVLCGIGSVLTSLLWPRRCTAGVATGVWGCSSVGRNTQLS